MYGYMGANGHPTDKENPADVDSWFATAGLFQAFGPALETLHNPTVDSAMCRFIQRPDS